MLGLHGHVSPAGGAGRMGPTIMIDLDGDHVTGPLGGAFITLERDTMVAHRLVRG